MQLIIFSGCSGIIFCKKNIYFALASVLILQPGDLPFYIQPSFLCLVLLCAAVIIHKAIAVKPMAGCCITTSDEHARVLESQ
jgi:hypothetical protein